MITKAELERYSLDFDVISTRIIAGRLNVFVLSAQLPATGFEPVYPGLEEVYFTALFGIKGKREAVI
ncbi:hypothetical protein D3C73_1319510 [compost metagenome]